ncbi:MAG TPA: hypothetical protein VM737_10420, partial [Gemmatimonadota bacterium]|nr:hypothetical protein [Gemmatimonadota bacterium]
ALMDACEAAAAEMTGARAVFAVTDTNGTTALNAAAAQVWLDLEATRETTFTPEQRERIAALEAATRHGPPAR